MLTFTILFDGIPMVYQGQEQHYSGSQTPQNRAALWTSKYSTTSPLYTLTRTLNRLRKHATALDPSYLSTKSYPIYKGGSETVIRKGTEGRQVIMILSSQGSNSTKYMMTIPMSYGPGTVAMDVLKCVNYTVDSTEQLTVEMEKGEPRVLFPAKLLRGSGLCGFEEVKNSSSPRDAEENGVRVREKGGTSTLVGGVVALAVVFLM